MVPKEILVTYISEMIFTFYTIRGSRKQILHINHDNKKRDKSVFISHDQHCVDIHLSDRLLSSQDYTITMGERYCQLIFVPCFSASNGTEI